MKKIKAFLSPWISDQMTERIVIIGVAIIIILIILYYAKRAIKKHVDDPAKKYRAKKISNIFAYFLLMVVTLFTFSDKLGGLGVTFGLASAGIAFALSEVITSFAGWLSIMFTNQVKVGQRVKIGDLRGDIIDIQILKTTIMELGDWVKGDLYNGRITTISNSFVFKEAIQNYSADYPFLWDEIEVPLRTNSDHELASKLFTNIANEICGEYAKQSKSVWVEMQDKFRIENAKLDPQITLRFDENWITFTIRYVVDFQKRRTTKDLLFKRLLDEINKTDDILMIATATLEVTNVVEEQNQ